MTGARRGGTGHSGAHHAEIDAAGGAVDQRHAVEEETRGERAEQEILERGLIGALIVAQIAGQDVAGDGGDLQADEDDDQVVGRGHDGLAGDGEQQQRVVLAGFGVLAFQETGTKTGP